MVTVSRHFSNLGAALVLMSAAISAVSAQEAAKAPTQQAPSINYRERPRYPFDPQRLKRRPTLDGVINANEWDPLYTITDSQVKGTVYVNWDDEFLYLAAKTDQPGYLVFDIDASADGWLRGADNLELTVAPGADNSTAASITARILDAAGNKDTPVWNDKVVDTKSIQVVQKAADGGWVVEIAIPKGIAGISPRAGATMGIRADLLPLTAAAAPTAPYEPHLLLDITLVEARTTSVPGVAVRLLLDDNKVVPGQNLRAFMEINNLAEEALKIRSISFQGEAAAADILTTVKEVNIEAVKGFKGMKQKFTSTLPITAVPGFYQLTSTAVLENGKTVTSTTSFSIVEPFALTISTDPATVNVVGPTQLKIFVDIACAAPGYTKADVEIDTPAGWEVKGRKKKDFSSTREDSVVRSPFYITLPSTTQAGDYVVHAAVTWKGRTWKSHMTIHISATTVPAPAPATPPAKKP